MVGEPAAESLQSAGTIALALRCTRQHRAATADTTMPDRSLLTCFDEIRGKTLRLIDVPAEQAQWTPGGTENHILWHAGHIFVMVERLVSKALTRCMEIPPEIPDGWWPIFGWDSDPGRIEVNGWPSLAEVTGRLRQQQARLRRQLVRLADAEFSAPLDLPESSWQGTPVRNVILHAFHDEACHGGEIWLLRKLYRTAQQRMAPRAG